MFKYAQLDDGNRVFGISYLKDEVFAANMILINDLDVELGSTYNRPTGEFIPPEPQPEIEPQPTLEEMQAQTLLNTEMLLIQKELETEASL